MSSSTSADYLEKVRLGDLRAVSSNRNNVEPMLNELCGRDGSHMKGAFLTALAGFDPDGFIEAAGLTDRDRATLATRGGKSLTQAPG